MNARSMAFGTAMLAILLGVASACDDESTSTNAAPGNGDAGLADAEVDGNIQPTDAGVDSGLYPSDTTKIVFTSKGGGPLPAPPDGSVCQQVDITYTILVPSRELSWQVCEGSNDAPYTYRTGQRTLTAEQLATIETKLRALTRTTTVKCGADKPLEQLTLTTPSGEITYVDDFYFCDPSDPKLYVAGMEDVFTAITLLAQ